VGRAIRLREWEYPVRANGGDAIMATTEKADLIREPDCAGPALRAALHPRPSCNYVGCHCRQPGAGPRLSQDASCGLRSPQHHSIVAGGRRKSFSNSSRGVPLFVLSGPRCRIRSCSAVKSGRFFRSSVCCIVVRSYREDSLFLPGCGIRRGPWLSAFPRIIP
jgi:hypothetical protein